MSSFDLTRPVVRELRAAKPRAPEGLRERVLVSSRQVPEPRFALPSWLTVRRVALVAAPAVVVVGVGAALIHGIANSGPPPSVTPSKPIALRQKAPTLGVRGEAPTRVPQPNALSARSDRALGKRAAEPFSPIAPSKSRLQDYRAALTVRVDGLDGLSPATQKAMRTARALGGYVVSAQFNAQKQGYSDLVFRIPVTRVQQAIASFSELGKIATQDIRITDLQIQFNRLVKRINTTRVAIAKVDDRLADPSLSNEERVRLQQRRAALVSALESLTTSKGQTQRRAALATVSLTLTTEQAAAAHKSHHRGTLGRAFDDAGTILAKEVSWLLYALVVVGPLAVLALIALVLVRLSRRYADRRLLESS